MNKRIPLEDRARIFLLEHIYGNKKRYSFSNPEFAEEAEFLESHGYALKRNNFQASHYLTNAGIKFIINEQKPYNS